jgi:hypothetical protein
MKKTILFCTICSIVISLSTEAQQERPVWSKEKAAAWYAKIPWMAGANYISSNAINQLEMWQAESFDSLLIDRELGYAEGIGMSVMRVYLHHLAWQADKDGFRKRMNSYLNAANRHKIKTIFVLFDDVWNDTYKLGKQPNPKPGTHNSGWVQDPGKLVYMDLSAHRMLETYVKDILTTFKNDQRILLWDLYNEPGNSGHGNHSMDLLKKVFSWGRQVNPSQPLTAGVWLLSLTDLNKVQLENSDVISYHNYSNETDHKKWLDSFLIATGRPLICTEYMARTRGSRFDNIMPLLKQQKIIAINWVLYQEKQTPSMHGIPPCPMEANPAYGFMIFSERMEHRINRKRWSLLKLKPGKSRRAF